jgi:hypothetical protein
LPSEADIGAVFANVSFGPEADVPECGAEPTWWSARQLYQFNPSARAVEIAAMLMARYRLGEIKSGDVSQLIQLLGKLGFAAKDRSGLNLPSGR